MSQPRKHVSGEPSEKVEGWQQKKTNVEIKMGRGGAPARVDQDISDYGVNVACLLISILSRKDVTCGGFSCLLTLQPCHLLIPITSFFFFAS